MDNVINLGMPKRNPKEGELIDDLMMLLERYNGEISTAGMYGCLELVKVGMISQSVMFNMMMEPDEGED